MKEIGMRTRKGIAVAIGFATFVAFAGPLDDLKQSLTQGVSGAVNNATNSALGALGQSTNAAATPQGQANKAGGSTGIPSRNSALASTGSALCITQENRGTHAIFFKNTCADPVIAIISLPSNTCTTPGLKPGGGVVLAAGRVIASCRKAGRIQSHDCQCPSGTEITSASDTSPMAAPASGAAAPPTATAQADFGLGPNGCPARGDDPRYRTMSKKDRCLILQPEVRR